MRGVGKGLGFAATPKESQYRHLRSSHSTALLRNLG
jgi:hypothetical protein